MTLKSSRKIKINNLPIDKDHDFLDLFFSNPRYGSHEIVTSFDQEIHGNTKTTIVEFEDDINEEDIKIFNKIELNDIVLQSELVSNETYMHNIGKKTNQLSKLLLVKSLDNCKIDSEYVLSYLSNKNVGGTILGIQELKENNCFLVKFEELETVRKVLAKKHLRICVEQVEEESEMFEECNNAGIDHSDRRINVDHINKDLERLEENNSKLYNEEEPKIDDLIADLDSYKCSLLLKMGFIVNIKNIFPELIVKIIPRNGIVKLNGFKDSIYNAKNQINQILNNIKEKKIDISTNAIHFYQSCSTYIDRLFTNQSIIAIIELKNNQLLVRSFNESDIANAISLLKNEIDEFHYQLKDESLDLLDNDYGEFINQLKTELEQTNEVDQVVFLISKQNKMVSLVGSKVLINNLLSIKIKDFFENNTRVSYVCQEFSQLDLRYLKLVKSNDIREKCYELSKRYNEIKFNFEVDNCGQLQFGITCFQRAYEILVNFIKNMLDRKITRKLIIDELGFNDIFEGEKGRKNIEIIEKRFECIVILNEIANEATNSLLVNDNHVKVEYIPNTIYKTRSTFGVEFQVIKSRIDQFKKAKRTITVDELFNDDIKFLLGDADSKNYDSISFPIPIKQGLSASVEVIVPSMVDSVFNYFESNTGKSKIKKVFFVDDQNAIIFQNYLECLIGPSIESNFETAPILTKSNRINIEIGSVIDETKHYDSIVITSSGDLDLSNGTLAQLILARAGISIQNELKKKYLEGLNDKTQIAVTGGGLMKDVKNIFYINIQSWTKSQEDILKRKYYDVLEKALEEVNKMLCRNLALPAIGTGILGYPKNKVAKWMFEIINKFFDKNPQSAIEKVNVVIYEKDFDTIRAFRDIQDQNQTSPRREVSYLPQGFGSLNVEILIDDILKTNRDVLVNPTDSYLNLDGAVSKVILERIGKSLVVDLKKKKLNNGIVWTDGFNLKCRKILHVDVRANPLKDTVMSILKEVEKLNFSSVALPVIGTGIQQNHNQKLVVRDILEAISEFSKQNQAIKNIEIYVYHLQKTLYDDFMEEMKNLPLNKSKVYNSNKYSADKKLKFTLISDTIEKINQAEIQIREIIQDNTKNLDINHEYIEKIDLKNIREIETLLENHYCKFSIEKDKQRISIRGPNHYADDCYRLINEKINKLLLNENKQTKAQLIAKDIQWEYECNKTKKWLQYNIFTNEQIEAAYQNKEQSVEITDENDEKCLIEFKNNVETLNGKVKYKIRRITQANKGISIQLPLIWDRDKTLDLIKLDMNTSEYKNIEDIFSKQGMQGKYNQIVSIERIQNQSLYLLYEAYKKRFIDRDSNTVNERHLFHGSTSDSIMNIWRTGFNRSYCGKNATAYGKGVYFALNSSYSHNYTNFTSNGARVGLKGVKGEMFLSKVLVGVSAAGNPSIETKTLPKQPDGTPVDSTVDNLTNPSIFVIYHDAQAYPEYLITYT